MSILKSKDVKTRKEHNCWGCAREFPKGSNLRSITSTDENGIHTIYWCEVCNEYWSKYMKENDVIMYGELRSEDFNGWNQIKNEINNNKEESNNDN